MRQSGSLPDLHHWSIQRLHKAIHRQSVQGSSEVQVVEHEEDLLSVVSITWIADRPIGPEIGIDGIRRMQRALSTPEVGGNARVVACSSLLCWAASSSLEAG